MLTSVPSTQIPATATVCSVSQLGNQGPPLFCDPPTQGPGRAPEGMDRDPSPYSVLDQRSAAWTASVILEGNAE